MNTRNIGGVVQTAGRYRGDDETSTKIVVQQLQTISQITADPSNPEGPLVVQYFCDPSTSSGQKGFVVEDQDEMTF